MPPLLLEDIQRLEGGPRSSEALELAGQRAAFSPPPPATRADGIIDPALRFAGGERLDLQRRTGIHARLRFGTMRVLGRMKEPYRSASRQTRSRRTPRLLGGAWQSGLLERDVDPRLSGRQNDA